MSDLIKVTYEIQIRDEQKFKSFYKALGGCTHYNDVETVKVERLIEDFIICQDIYKEQTNKIFSLEDVGLELVDSYAKVEETEEKITA